jgi:hypothetical protein
MSVFKLVLLSIVVPALIALAVFVLAWRPWRKDAALAGGLWGGALALGAGYIWAHLQILGWPRFPPIQAVHWLPFFVLAAMELGLLDAFLPGPGWVRWQARAVLVLAVLATLLQSQFKNTWSFWLGTAWLTGLSAAGVALWAVLESLAARSPRLSLPFQLLVLVSGSSLAAFLSGSAVLAQIGAALAAILGASLLVAWRATRFSLSRGAIPVVMILLGPIWLIGYFYSELPGSCAMLLGSALPLAWLVGLAARWRLSPWKVALCQVLAVLLLTTVAVAFASQNAPPQDDSFQF